MNRNSSNILPSPSPIASAEHSRSQLSKHRRHGNDISDQEINLYKNTGKDGQEIIEEIDEEEITRIYNQRDQLTLNKLDFSSDRYKLKQIVGLSKLPKVQKVTHINISNNELKSIYELNEFSEIEVIVAQGNKLETVDLRIPQLKKLILKYNLLRQFPQNWTMFENLTHLDISHNYIQSITEDQILHLKQLKKFFFNSNKITFKDSSMLNKLLIVFAQLLNLEEVNALDNPFVNTYEDTEWYDLLAYYMMSEVQKNVTINRIDYKPSQISTLRKNMKSLENNFDSKKNEGEQQNQAEPTALAVMVDLIENGNNNPVQCFTYIKKLGLEVEALMRTPKEWATLFYSKDPMEQLQIRKFVDEFFQNCVLFLNTQQAHMKNLIFILARMTRITTGDFGLKCFEVINEVAKTSDRSVTEIKKIIKQVCFKYMYRINIERIPLHVISGLIDTLLIMEDPFVYTSVHSSRANDWVSQMVIRYTFKPFVIQNSIYQVDQKVLQLLSLICCKKDKVKQLLKRSRNEFLDDDFGKSATEKKLKVFGEGEESEDEGSFDSQDNRDKSDEESDNDEDDNSDSDSYDDQNNGKKSKLNQQALDDDSDPENAPINFFDRVLILFSTFLKTSYNEQYVQCLRIIQNACKCEEEIGGIVAQLFLDTRQKSVNFMQILEDEISDFLRILKKGGNTLNDGVRQLSKEELRMRYVKFSELIKTYGSIYHYHKFRGKELQEHSPIILDLITIISLEFVDPVLLSAVCVFTRSLLDNGTVVQDQGNLSTIKTKTQKLSQLLPYLGDNKYEQLCKYLGVSAVNLMHQNEEVIQGLIHEIVLLFKWFSEKQTKQLYKRNATEVKKDFEMEYEQVSTFLEQQGRENNLFKCLAIPNDTVRLTVMECLMTVPIDQWKSQQICVLFNIANSYKSLGAGKTEKVLSNIFMIASKFCILSDDNKSKDFQVIYAENSVLDVQRILLSNMERDLREEKDEEDEKVELACACVSFLISLTAKDELRLLAKSMHMGQTIKKCLLLEEQCLSADCIPIEIERCWAGKYLVYLLPILQGRDSLFPYSYISFRILSRIADNLEVILEEPGENLKEFCLLYDFEQIHAKILNKFEDRKNRELELWEEIKDPLLVRPRETRMSDQTKEFKFAMSCNIIQVLINFLMGSNASQKSMVLESDLKKQFSELGFDNDLKDFMLSIVYRLRDDIQIHKGAGLLAHQAQNKTPDNFFSRSNMEELKKAFILLSPEMEDNNIQNYIDQAIQSPIIVKPKESKKAGGGKPGLLRKDDASQDAFERFSKISSEKKNKPDPVHSYKQTADVPRKLRTLMVSAMLRSIFALAQNCDDKSMLKQITSSLELRQNIKAISQLCYWAGWTDGNIAAKYLWVVNFMLQQSSECKKIDYIPTFEIVGKCCGEITKIVEKKIQEDEKSPLTDDMKITIKLLCQCVSTMISNICKFNWNGHVSEDISQGDTKEPSQVKNFGIPEDQFNECLLKSNLICLESLMQRVLPFQQFKTFVIIATFFMKSSTEFAKKQETPLDIDVRNQVMISLSSLIGTYICGMHSMRQEIIRIFTYADVFQKKIIRKSYLQAILSISQSATYELVLEKQIETMNQQEGKKDKLLGTFRVHFRQGIMGKFEDGFLVVLRNEIRILRFSESLFTRMFQDPHISVDENLSNVLTIKDAQLLEVLVMESCQRQILRMSGNSAESLFLFFMDKGNAETFMATIKTKLKYDIYSNHAFSLRLLAMQQSQQQSSNSTSKGDKTPANKEKKRGENVPVVIQRPTINPTNNYLQWVCVNPDGADLSAAVDNKVFMILDSASINFFQEKNNQWMYFGNSRSFELKTEDEIFDMTSDEVDRKKKDKTLSQKQFDAMQTYFVQALEPVKIATLKQVVFDQTVITQAILKMQNKQMNIQFFSDQERENFRNEMMQRIQIPKWSQRFDKMDVRS